MNWRQRLDKWLRISVRRKLLDDHLEILRSQMSGKVLEVGAGRNGRRGEFRPPFGDAEKWIYVNLFSEQRPHIQTDIQSLPFRAEWFDTVICLEVVEYVFQPEVALQKMRRVLKPSGKLILSVPFMHRIDSGTDYWRFTEPGISRLFEENGFQVLEITRQGGGIAVAVNILKYWIHVGNASRRLWYALFLQPILSFLWSLDQTMTKKMPVLGGFTTGYLILAIRNKETNLVGVKVTNAS